MATILTDRMLDKARQTLAGYCGIRGYLNNLLIPGTRVMADRVEALISNPHVNKFSTFSKWYLDLEMRAPRRDLLHEFGKQVREGFYETILEAHFLNVQGRGLTTLIVQLFELFPKEKALQMKVINHLKNIGQFNCFILGNPSKTLPLIIRLCNEQNCSWVTLSVLNPEAIIPISLFYRFWKGTVPEDDQWRWYLHIKMPEIFLEKDATCFEELIKNIGSMKPENQTKILSSLQYRNLFAMVLERKDPKLIQVMMAPIASLPESAESSSCEIMKNIIQNFFWRDFEGLRNLAMITYRPRYDSEKIKLFILEVFNLNQSKAYEFLNIIFITNNCKGAAISTNLCEIILSVNDIDLKRGFFNFALSLEVQAWRQALLDMITASIPSSILQIYSAQEKTAATGYTRDRNILFQPERELARSASEENLLISFASTPYS